MLADRRSPLALTIEERLTHLIPSVEARRRLRQLIFHALAVLTIVLGLRYFAFRVTESLNPSVLAWGLVLLAAELYAFGDTLLFIITLWKPKDRTLDPPEPLPGRTVDVFIPTYNEPESVLRPTVEAAARITYQGATVYVLDDGSRPWAKALAEEVGVAYIARGKEWDGYPRHAKAGNLNNALNTTTGEFVLILDSDQVVEPSIVDKLMGYFRDPLMAFVQTPQYAHVDEHDMFGSQSLFFYGPVQMGKDRYNAAYFCGTNALIRREALFQVGLVSYVERAQQQVRAALRQIALGDPVALKYRPAARRVRQQARRAIRRIKRGEPVSAVLTEFNVLLRNIRREALSDDLTAMLDDLTALEDILGERAAEVRTALEGDHVTQDALSETLRPSYADLGITEQALDLLQLRSADKLDVQPVATYSITEDIATSIHIHALGWKSAFHNEVLARGLPPLDLGGALAQKTRWATGNLQVQKKDNPLTRRGLRPMQRVMYFATMYGYFVGFANFVFLLTPALFLLFDVRPVLSFTGRFLWFLLPYLLINRLMVRWAAGRIKLLRSEQYTFAMFSVWINAVLTAFTGRKPNFHVTRKAGSERVPLHLILPQIAVGVLLITAVGVGFVTIFTQRGLSAGEWAVNFAWACWMLFNLSIVFRAITHKQPDLKETPA